MGKRRGSLFRLTGGCLFDACYKSIPCKIDLVPFSAAHAPYTDGWLFPSLQEDDVSARPVTYPAHIEPLVQCVDETSPEPIITATHTKLQAGTPVKDMLLASALAVVCSSDLPPDHHGGPLHPLAGLYAVHHMVIASEVPRYEPWIVVTRGAQIINVRMISDGVC